MKSPEIPSHVPISVIATFTGQAPRNIQAWAVAKKVPKAEGRKGYPFLETVTAVREILSNRDGGAAAEIAVFKHQQAKAEAESAQLDVAKKKRLLVFAEDAEAINRDYRARVELTLQGADFIPRPLRDRLGVALSRIKLEAIPNAARDKK